WFGLASALEFLHQPYRAAPQLLTRQLISQLTGGWLPCPAGISIISFRGQSALQPITLLPFPILLPRIGFSCQTQAQPPLLRRTLQLLAATPTPSTTKAGYWMRTWQGILQTRRLSSLGAKVPRLSQT